MATPEVERFPVPRVVVPFMKVTVPVGTVSVKTRSALPSPLMSPTANVSAATVLAPVTVVPARTKLAGVVMVDLESPIGDR